MKKMKSGFTLAEVLITLGIIGVIAAIVMPTVMTNYTFKTMGVKLSKFASQLEGSTRPFVVQNSTFTEQEIVSDYLAESFIISNYNDIMVGEQSVDCSVEDKPAVCGKSNDSKFKYTPGLVWSEEPDFSAANSEWDLTSVANDQNRIIELKDGTAFAAYMLPDTYIEHAEIRTGQVGQAAFGVAFAPQVQGIPKAVQKSYKFVVTELGYVFADKASDPCLADIYDAGFATNSKTFAETSACVVDGQRRNAGDNDGGNAGA